ncbi:dihydroorotase [Haloimpatiens lingqiaonensis]|uniref:dihydroorotase n=1 Tax=Haloimpatiens lingqiaonensis TaxID=1380675 RepID=UPI0010FDF790|nr:dihydroorotase [Haloimpatiens lingqiaonensis]
MELLIKNAKVVDSSQNFQGDVYIKDGVINEIGIDLHKQCQVLDAKGNTLTPAFVDLHAHFRDPGYTYKEDIFTGSSAAVKGGYTTVNLMANTNPVCSSMDMVNYVVGKGNKIGLVDINQVVSITEGLRGESFKHLEAIDKSVKFISDDGRGVQDSNTMLNAMVKAKEKGLTIIAHEENEDIKDCDTRLAENLMTWRDLTLAKVTGVKLHVTHVSTKEALKDIIEAKKSGLEVTCDVTPHHIALTKKEDYKVNPPLREKEDIDFLIEAIKNNYVDAIGTDHAPHSKEDKEKGANGISGIETAFSVCYTKLVKEKGLSLNKLVEIMSKNPAKIMGVNKGEVKIGYKGDLVLIDLNKKYTVDCRNFKSKGKNSPFQGKEVFGEIINTIKEGKIVYSRED